MLVLIGLPEGRKTSEYPNVRYEYNIRMEVKEI
jgi:hypothetical protein